MVSLDIVQASNRTVVRNQPITAVFVGATQGIGEYSLRQLALAHGGAGDGPALRIYSLGRNEAAGRKILADAADTCPHGDFRSDRFSAVNPAAAGLPSTVADVATLTDGVRGGGAYKVNTKGDIMPLPKVYNQIDKAEVSQKIWDHTMKVFDEISKGNKFSR